jgi:hypothetical protein
MPTLQKYINEKRLNHKIGHMKQQLSFERGVFNGIVVFCPRRLTVSETPLHTAMAAAFACAQPKADGSGKITIKLISMSESTAAAAGAAAAVATGNRGRKRSGGSKGGTKDRKNWLPDHITLLLSFVRLISPKGNDGWALVAKRLNAATRAEGALVRDGDQCRTKFRHLQKPLHTGVHQLNVHQKEAIHVNGEIDAHSNVRVSDLPPAEEEDDAPQWSAEEEEEIAQLASDLIPPSLPTVSEFPALFTQVSQSVSAPAASVSTPVRAQPASLSSPPSSKRQKPAQLDKHIAAARESSAAITSAVVKLTESVAQLASHQAAAEARAQEAEARITALLAALINKA